MEPRPGEDALVPHQEPPREISAAIEADRWGFCYLIEICRDRLPEEEGIIVTPDNPMANLHAMILTRKVYGVRIPAETDKRFGLKPWQRQHLQKMMVVHHKTICPEEVAKSEQLTSFLLDCCKEEYEQFEGFQPDLSDLPYEWLLALEDVRWLQARLEGGKETE
jgi:hypothetical protein